MPKKIRLEDCPVNFRSKTGKPYVVRCPKCKQENWAPAVATGVCAMCGWDANDTRKDEE